MRFVLTTLIAGLSLAMTGCLPPDSSCQSNFDQVVTPDKIQGNNQLVVSMDKLQFLFAGNGFQVSDVDLELDLQGTYKTTDAFVLSSNGIKLSRQDAQPLVDSVTLNKGVSQTHFKIHNFAQNGGTPFVQLLTQLNKNHGQLIIQVDGKAINLKTAKLEFKGSTQNKCPSQPIGIANLIPAVTTINSVSPAGSKITSSSILFNFSANQTGVTFYCSLDAAAPVKCTSPQAYANLKSAAHDFKVFTVNVLGLKEIPGADYKFTVSAPSTSVTTITNLAQLPTLTNKNSQTIQFSATNASSFKCSLDNASAVACISPVTYSGLPDGAHVFSVQAYNASGVASGAPASFSWTLDTVAPTTSITDVSPFASPSNVNTRTITFSTNETANFQCSLDGAGFAACVSPLALSALSQGSHILQINATDLAGNVGPTVSSSWVNDYTAPVITLGDVSPAAGQTAATGVTINFSLNEPGTAYCAQDGGAAAVCSSPYTWSNWSLGQHTFSVYAIDVAGNQGAATSLSWTVLQGPPVLSFSQILPSSAFFISSNNVSLTIASSEPVTLTERLNGAEVDTANPLAFNGLPDGGYSVYAIGVAADGQTSDPIVHNFIVDTTAPQLSVTSDDTAPVTTLDHRTFTFTQTDDNAGGFLCNLDGQGFSACASPLVLAGLAQGSHTLAVQAVDNAGNTTEVDQSWIVQLPVSLAGQ